MGKASDYIPALKYGHKIQPNDIAGMIGAPYVGDIFYVDGNSGNDTSNSGKRFNDAYATVAAAKNAMTANQYDTTIIAPSGGTGRAAESTAIVWDKRFTNLVGNGAPLAQDTRSGINFSAGGSLIISETGCRFNNLTMFSSADIDETVSVTGDYNSFLGVDFKGTSNATSADDTKWRALNLQGQENYFGGCTLGGDTYTRGVANTTLEFESVASRNVFEACKFIAHIDTAGSPTHVLFTGSSAIDRWIEFKDCSFYSFSTNNTQAMTACMNLSAQSGTGHVLVTGLPYLSTGITDWEATASGRIQMQAFNTATATIGIAINPTV